jgi:hypothetical protein
MQRRELLVSVAHGERLRRLDEAARPLGVFFNIHVSDSLGLPHSPLRHDCGIFIGYPRTALTFLNRPRVVALFSGLVEMWALAAKTEGAGSQFRERWHMRRECPMKLHA